MAHTKERLDLKKEFAHNYGLKETRSLHANGLHFLNRKCPIYEGMPAGDHITYWNKNGRPFCIVSQPYNICESECLHIFEVCMRYGLRAEISGAPSWHFVGQVVTVIYYKRLA